MIKSDPFIFAIANMKLAYSILKQGQFCSCVVLHSHLHSFWLGRKICPPPERLELGFIHGQQFWEGRKVLYSCEPGYWLSGSLERHCLKNGSWSGNQPSCILPGNTYVYNLIPFLKTISTPCQSEAQHWTQRWWDVEVKSTTLRTKDL